jgi:protein tyrosine phosphatase
MTDDDALRHKLAQYREALDRADALVITQGQLVRTLQELAAMQQAKIQSLESRLEEALCLPS